LGQEANAGAGFVIVFVLLMVLLVHHRLGRAVEEAKRRVTKANKAQHAAEVAAAELRGKAEAEREASKAELAALTQQLEAAKAQVSVSLGQGKEGRVVRGLHDMHNPLYVKACTILCYCGRRG
jgi:uncharacterized membrane protein YqiK